MNNPSRPLFPNSGHTAPTTAIREQRSRLVGEVRERLEAAVRAAAPVVHGTVVRVENVASGRWVNVVIRDRGPHEAGRIIDLSDEAFRRIGSLSQGVIRVRIRW